MPSIVHGKPAKFERLTHVDSLYWYDGELLGQYTLDGEHWLVLWTNHKDLGTHYWDQHVYYSVSDDNLKKLLDNTMTLRATLEKSNEMWSEESKWEKHPNGHGVPDTNVDTWNPLRWSDIPEDIRPTVDSYLNFKKDDHDD